MEHTIIFIINGGITGRQAGEGASNIVINTIEKLKKGEPIVDHLSYLTKASNGKILKSSTVFIKDMSGKYRYILSINFDITNFLPFKSDLDTLLQTENKSKLEEIPNSAQELMEKLIIRSEELVGKPASIMNKDEKIKAIKFLNDSGVFLITKSGDKVSNHFGISKFTLYNYIDSKKEDINE